VGELISSHAESYNGCDWLSAQSRSKKSKKRNYPAKGRQDFNDSVKKSAFSFNYCRFFRAIWFVSCLNI